MAEKAEVILSARDQTGPAFAAAQKNFLALKTIALGVAAGFTSFKLAIQPALQVLEHFNPKAVIDAADGLNKLSQKTGIAVETLSGYQHAAKLADVSNEELNIGLKKLSLNIAAAARGEQEQAAAFQAIGISQKFLRDNVNNTDKVFEEVAARFEGYNDGANKNAIANALFGKSFESLIPLLNTGRRGLVEARTELERYGGIISGDLAAKSEQFNDNLTRLATASGALKVEIASGLIDALVRVSERMVDASKSGGILKAALLELANVPTTVVGLVDLLVPKPNEIEQLQSRADNVAKVVEKLREKVAADPGNLPLIARLRELEQELTRVQTRLAKAQEDDRAGKIGVPANTGAFTRTDHDRTPVKDKPNAPPLPGSGDASKAEALLKKQLDGRLKELQAGLERERDLFQFNDQRLAELFAHGDLSIDEFYEAKSKAQLEYLAKQQEGFTAEIAALRAHQAKTKDPTAKADDENKIKEVIAEQAKVFREAGQAAEVAGVQQSRAATAFAQSLREVDAQLAELAGDKFGAELLRNAQRLDDARKTLSGKTGGDPARLQALQNALDLQARANKEQESAQRLATSAANAEELFNINAKRAGLSREETERGLLELHEKQLGALDDQIVRFGELVKRSAELNKGIADPALLEFYENLKLARERAFDAKDPGLIRFNELATQAGDAIARSFEDAVIEGGKLREILQGLAKDLFRLVYNEVITKPLAAQVTGVIKDVFGKKAAPGSSTAADVGTGVAKQLGFSSDAKPGTPASVPLTTGDFTRTDHDTTPVGQPVPTVEANAAAQLAAMEQATAALQALTDAANAASGALGKAPGAVAPAAGQPTPPGAPVPAATVFAGDTDGEDYGNEARRASQDQAAQSLDSFGQSATSNAATFDTAISQLAASALRGTAALGSMPSALNIFASYLTQALSSSGGGGGGGGGGIWGQVFNAAFSYFTGGSGLSVDTSGYDYSGGSLGDNSLTGDMIRNRRAVGGSVEADAMYEVNERGPELLEINGKQMLMMGSKPGRVIPNDRLANALRPNEVPAILMGGPKGTREEVLRADDPRHQDNPAFQSFLAQLWKGAPRYHSGGVVGMLERGQMSAAVSGGNDRMQRADEQPRAALSMEGALPPLHVYVTPPPGASRDTMTQSGVQIGQGIQRALRRNGG